MKTLIYIAFAAFLVLSVGCTKETANDGKQIERPPRVLRDPFRPDHPTRAEWEAEKERKELEQPQK